MFVFAVNMPVCLVGLPLLASQNQCVCVCPPFSVADIIEGDPGSSVVWSKTLPEPSTTDVVIASWWMGRGGGYYGRRSSTKTWKRRQGPATRLDNQTPDVSRRWTIRNGFGMPVTGRRRVQDMVNPQIRHTLRLLCVENTLLMQSFL